MKSQIWHPDTCQCIIQQEYDDSLPVDEIVISVVDVLRKCEFHNDINNTNQDIYDTIMDENPRKNRSISKIIENAPEEWIEVINQRTGERGLKEGIVVDYDFIVEQGKEKRTLELSVIGVDSNTLTPTRKTDIQSTLDTEFSDKEKNGDVVFKDVKPIRDDIATTIVDDHVIRPSRPPQTQSQPQQQKKNNG